MCFCHIHRGRDGQPAMLAAPTCSDQSQRVTLVPSGNATADTTWVLSSVGPTRRRSSTFGFAANITSLARLNGACPNANATTLGVVDKPIGTSGLDVGSCSIQEGARMIPGVDVKFDLDGRTNPVGGWAILPVQPAYCSGNAYSQCYPDSILFS